VLLRHEVINQDGEVVLTFNIPELVARRAGSTTERAPAP
jgi:hypothetical protein